MTRAYNVSDLNDNIILHNYTKLLQWGPTNKLLAYIAANIKVQDSLKIIFDNKSFSHYD
ncbi:hypothetical protein RAMDARK_0591 [Rickettsia amblyommatis str. Darkwater]|uniref:Uncharacterized protein n=1 Tax=Rickettsia amblyommatis str. Ac/Pa TaxID=1359164 RepID=A0A0F3N1Y6_RICAM|nr:hypothetical protein APHACPA_0857 [Rickettsia amblyommatis str. Ac/Pa]KJV96809.1 hypothetical protein RAMDARK_0591 [Rickettsia amblyommatis str. Darkwater]